MVSAFAQEEIFFLSLV